MVAGGYRNPAWGRSSRAHCRGLSPSGPRGVPHAVLCAQSSTRGRWWAGPAPGFGLNMKVGTPRDLI